MKRILAWLLSLALAASLVPAVRAAGAADGGTCGANLVWSLEDGVLTISGSGDMAEYETESYVPWSAHRFDGSIREVRVGGDVTSLCDRAFLFCDKLSSVSFGAGSRLERVGEAAFSGCAALASLSLPDGVKEIGGHALSGTGLTSFTIPAGLRTLGAGAFSGAARLASVSVAAGSAAFRVENGALLSADGTTLLLLPAGDGRTSFAVPRSVTAVADEAFYGCRALAAVSLPCGLKTVGGNAFSRSGLREAVLPDGLTSLAPFAFAACPALRRAVLPESLKTVADGAFRDCPALAEAVLPQGVEKLGACAFAACPSLKAVAVPESVTEIGSDAFSNVCAAGDGAFPDHFDPYPGFALRGWDGSYAQRWAAENGVPFTVLRDAVSAWAEADVARARTAGILPPALYRGDYTRAITRGEFCSLVGRMLIAGGKLTLGAGSAFADTDSPYVAALRAAGVVQGCSEAVFAPDDPLTRQEAAAMLSRILARAGKTVELGDPGCAYRDAADFAVWARSGAAQVSAAGVMRGTGGSRFRPLAACTAEQAAAAVLRLSDRI